MLPNTDLGAAIALAHLNHSFLHCSEEASRSKEGGERIGV